MTQMQFLIVLFVKCSTFTKQKMNRSVSLIRYHFWLFCLASLIVSVVLFVTGFKDSNTTIQEQKKLVVLELEKLITVRQRSSVEKQDPLKMIKLAREICYHRSLWDTYEFLKDTNEKVTDGL
jgi:hypothetical protein